MLSFTIYTLFPEIISNWLSLSVISKARDKGLWDYQIIDLKEYGIKTSSNSKYRQIDDEPYGGGNGMVIRADVVGAALEEHFGAANISNTLHNIKYSESNITNHLVNHSKILLYSSPKGIRLNQNIISAISGKNIHQDQQAPGESKEIHIICGRYEGIDQRILEAFPVIEISLGDYIISGGELAASIIIDSAVRLLDGAISDNPQENLNPHQEESVSPNSNLGGLLEYPHYTRPKIWQERPIPEILTSGNHAAIKKWRLEQAQNLTRQRRPDLWQKYICPIINRKNH